MTWFNPLIENLIRIWLDANGSLFQFGVWSDAQLTSWNNPNHNYDEITLECNLVSTIKPPVDK
jgi:hypothetical protein